MKNNIVTLIDNPTKTGIIITMKRKYWYYQSIYYDGKNWKKTGRSYKGFPIDLNTMESNCKIIEGSLE